MDDLDALDKRILYTLQRDSRHASTSDIADEMDVSPSTVRKRITRLEDRGIIRGYHADIDYQRTGYQLHTLIVCTAPIDAREQLAREALDVPGVVAVREVMTGGENIHVSALGADHDDLSRIGQDLSAIGLEVADEDLIRNEYVNPFDSFRSADER
ncbi:Lrp/AsnC family transcriptional regulator [Haladaptatus salinisoli]|uniref:Lrp/AsnC family transcriptional regulator n=1 Tax=Haladaptatus salinisoli TaxID=2884876 RepID=UPI001D0AFA43|nr:Lrp/AsnC family transcriptional regulator [Haladaptatus salinisoli]